MNEGAEGRGLAGPWPLAALATLVALAVLMPGLGAHGLWSDAELPVFQRTRAALGAPLSELVRSPWLPDQLRTLSFQALGPVLGSEAALRLPHAVASALLVGLAAGLARARGAGVHITVVVAGFALSFPLLASSARTLLGNPVGDLLAAMGVVAGLAAANASRGTVQRAASGLLGVACLAGAVASLGLLFGAAVPVAVVGLALRGGNPWPARVLAATALALAAATAWLAFNQGDGYIPLLGAAKDLEVLDDPTNRHFTETLEDLGYQLFPWAPLAILGALAGSRDTWPAAWLAVGLTAAVGWNLIYGAAALPVTVPAAVCAAAGFEVLCRGRPTARRFSLLAVVLLMLAFAKDAERTPSEVYTPLYDFTAELGFPDKELDATGRLQRLGRLALLGLLGAFVLWPHRDESRWQARTMGRIPRDVRMVLSYASLLTVLLDQAAVWAHGLADEASDRMSPRAVLAVHRSLVEAGSLPPQLGAHRVRDPAVEIYGPPSESIIQLKGRRELGEHLSAASPAAALIRSSDLAAIHQQHREHGWPMFVLDRSHSDLVLVANVLPEGYEDQNPIPAILPDAPPALAHETFLRFEDYVEIIGWEVEEPVVRGSSRTLQMTFRVLRPLPAGTKLWARLTAGKTSRIAAEPHELTGDLYPPNYWRAGDIVLHRHTFETPVLEIVSGPHDLVVGLRRSEKKNLEITEPTGETGDFGVVIRNNKRTFAVIGQVEVL